METFSDWLIKKMKIAEMSQADLARRSGLTTATISRILQETRKPGHEACEAIARALDLPPETVFRAAGLLPPNNEQEAINEILRYKIAELTPDQQEDLLVFIEYLQAKGPPPGSTPTPPKKQRQGSRPGEVVSAKE